jgi:hypothetical protein
MIQTNKLHDNITIIIVVSLLLLLLLLLLYYYGSRDSSISITTGWTAGIRFLAEAKDFSLFHSVHTVSGANSACLIGTGGSFLGAKAAGA